MSAAHTKALAAALVAEDEHLRETVSALVTQLVDASRALLDIASGLEAFHDGAEGTDAVHRFMRAVDAFAQAETEGKL